MDIPELKRRVSLPEVFITATVMVIVSWAWNRLSEAYDISGHAQTQIDTGREFRSRELDDVKRRVERLEGTDIEILKMMSERSRQ